MVEGSQGYEGPQSKTATRPAEAVASFEATRPAKTGTDNSKRDSECRTTT
jgi:hypothetical protein